MRAWVFGDNLDTDVITPGRYMKLPVEEIAQHCLEAVSPEFSAQVRPGDAVVDFAPAKSQGGPGFVPFAGVASDLGIKDFALGVALYVPFGAELRMPDNGSQRHIVTRVALHAIHVTPTVAYRFFKRLSVGLGLSYINASFLLLRQIGADALDVLLVILGVVHPDDYRRRKQK